MLLENIKINFYMFQFTYFLLNKKTFCMHMLLKHLKKILKMQVFHVHLFIY